MDIEFSADALRELRQAQDKSRRALAAEIGLSQLTVTAYEHGRTVPSIRVIGRLAGALDCPIDAFFRIRQGVA